MDCVLNMSRKLRKCFPILRFCCHTCFATLTDKVRDEEEQVLREFAEYASVPIINMESATAHPLQALADGLTIQEQVQVKKPKIVLRLGAAPQGTPPCCCQFFYSINGPYRIRFCDYAPRRL